MLAVVGSTAGCGVGTLLSSMTGAEAGAEEKHAVRPWAVENKYYSADVEVHPFRYHESPEATSSGLSSAEAAILIIDLSTPAPLSDLNTIGSQLEASWADCSTRLCVGTKLDLAGSVDLVPFREWALDHQFEFVECDARDASGQDEREKFGVARIIEALQSTMWSTMVRAAPPSSFSRVALDTPKEAASRYAPPGGEGAGAGAGAGSSGSVSARDPDVGAGVDTADEERTGAGTMESDADADKAAATSLSLPPPPELSATSDPPSGDGAPVGDAPVDTDGSHAGMTSAEAESAFESLSGLDSLMNKIRDARDTAHGRSDGERRQNAASLAMQLAAMLGLEPDSEEEEEEEEGEEEG